MGFDAWVMIFPILRRSAIRWYGLGMTIPARFTIAIEGLGGRADNAGGEEGRDGETHGGQHPDPPTDRSIGPDIRTHVVRFLPQLCFGLITHWYADWAANQGHVKAGADADLQPTLLLARSAVPSPPESLAPAPFS